MGAWRYLDDVELPPLSYCSAVVVRTNPLSDCLFDYYVAACVVHDAILLAAPVTYHHSRVHPSYIMATFFSIQLTRSY
jgi:hypothetical protein